MFRGLPPELEQFVARTPEDPFLRRAWGMALLYQGEASRAWPHLEAAAQGLVNDPIGGFALAECRIMNGAPVQIENVLGSQPELPDEAAQWWLFRGRIEETTGQTERAVDSFARAIALQPEGREAHFRLGQILKRLGYAGAAQSHLALAGQIEQKTESGPARASTAARLGTTQRCSAIRASRAIVRRCRNDPRVARLV